MGEATGGLGDWGTGKAKPKGRKRPHSLFTIHTSPYGEAIAKANASARAEASPTLLPTATLCVGVSLPSVQADAIALGVSLP